MWFSSFYGSKNHLFICFSFIKLVISFFYYMFDLFYIFVVSDYDTCDDVSCIENFIIFRYRCDLLYLSGFDLYN